MVALAAVKRVKEAMDIARARQQAGVNVLGGVQLRRIPSDLTSITIGSQDSNRSGGTEEYKSGGLADIMGEDMAKPAELEDVTDDDVV